MLRKINEALLDAYTEESLTRLVKFELGENLQEVAGGNDFTSTVFHLTDWAERGGKLRDLVEAAKKDSANEKLALLDVPLLKKTVLASSSSELLRENVVSIEVLSYHIEELKKEVQKLSTIVTGPTGTNGLNSVSRENKQDIQEILARLDRLEKAIASGPDLFASSAAKIVFGVIMSMAFVTAFVVVAGALGYF